MGSPITVDYDGNVHPLGKPGDQPDIGADETNLDVPVELSNLNAN